MTRQQLTDMTLGYNQVLVQLDRSQDEYKMAHGDKLYIDPSFEPEKHAPITGTIVNICESLYFSPVPGRPHSLKWDTDIELQCGDYVISYYLTAVNAFKEQDGRVMRDEKREVYLLVRYDQIFVAKRNGSVVTCNGWNILEPVVDYELQNRERSAKIVGLTLPFSTDGVSMKMARVVHTAKSLRRYRDPRSYDFQDPINVGDIVAVRRNALLPLEYDFHASLEGRKVFYRVQREFMYATIDESILV